MKQPLYGVCYRFMAAKNNGNIFFYIPIIFILPLSAVLYFTSVKAVKLFITHRADYIFTDATIVDNNVKKYNNRAMFKGTYNGKVLEGNDRGMLWSGTGDVVKVYFNRHNLQDNGIVSQLVTLLVGQLLFFTVLVIIIFFNIKSRIKLTEQYKDQP